MIKFKQSGSFKNTERFLSKAQRLNMTTILKKYAEEGVNALSLATPVDTGKTASSWNYSILINKRFWSISWFNTNIVDGAPIAILLQYGHATRAGGFVQGYDYINPALKPIFDTLADAVWKEVVSL